MAKNITDLSELNKYIMDLLPEMIETLASDVKQKWHDNLQSMFYDARMTSDDYHRSEDMLNALTVSAAKKNGNSVTCEIYYDTDKIRHYGVQEGTFPSHQSIADGSSFIQQMPNFIEYGNMQNGGHPIVEFDKGAGAMDATYQYYISSKEYLTEMKLMLEEQLGVKCIIV